MNTKAEAMKQLDELEKKVEILNKGWDALERRALQQAQELKELQKANEDLKHQAKAEFDRAENLMKERDRLRWTLNGYADLGKALGKIRGEAGVDPESVRKIVQEEVAKVSLGSGSTGDVQITATVPNVNLTVSKPWLTLDETTMEGRISVLALGGKIQAEERGFTITDVLQALSLHYNWKAGGGKERNRLKDALGDLVGKYKLLERTFDTGDKQYFYTVRKDVESRVKESETRETAEAE